MSFPAALRGALLGEHAIIALVSFLAGRSALYSRLTAMACRRAVFGAR